MKGTFRVEGLKELDKALEELAAATTSKAGAAAVRKALVAAAKPVVAHAQALVPVKTGALRDSIKVVGGKVNLIGKAEYRAVMESGGSVKEASSALRSARRSAKAAGVEKYRVEVQVRATAPHAYLVEFGTAPHRIAAKNAKALFFDGSGVQAVDHPGASPRPFMRPAWEASKSGVLVDLKISLGDEIQKAAKRAARGAGGPSGRFDTRRSKG